MGDLLDRMQALSEQYKQSDEQYGPYEQYGPHEQLAYKLNMLDAGIDMRPEKQDVIRSIQQNDYNPAPILAGNKPPDNLVDRMNDIAASSFHNTEPLSAMDYILDGVQEFGAGIPEGLSLQNIDLGNVGPDTSVGDVARWLGQMTGSVPPYMTIAAGLGYLGLASAPISLPAVLLRGAATGFTGRMISGVLSTDEDIVDRLENSMVSAGLGATFAALPYAMNKLVMTAKGGPSAYMESLKAKLKTTLVKRFYFTEDKADDAVLAFTNEVNKQGGPSKLNASMIKRTAKIQEKISKEWLPLNRSVHGLAKRSLGLSNDQFHKINIERIGEAHTNKMNIEQLKSLRNFYKQEFTRYKKINKFLPDKMNYEDMQSAYTDFEPGIFSQHRPVNRVMDDMGFGSLYDKVYDKEVQRLTYVKVYDNVRKKLVKAVPKKEYAKLFHLMDDTPVPENTKMKDIVGIYSKAAPDIPKKYIAAISWLRYTYQDMLNAQNVILEAEGLPTIKPRAAYVTYLIEDTVKALKGITPELWSIVKKKGAKKIFNGFLKDRIGNAGVVENPFLAHAAYTRGASKLIYLRPVSRYIKNSMDNAVELKDGKKIPKVLPISVRSYIDNWLDYGITEVSKDMDRHLNITLRLSARAMASRLKMASYRGHLLFNPMSVVRNATQADLNYANLGSYWVDGIKSLRPSKLFYENDNGWQFASKYCKLLQTRMVGFEGIDPTTIGKLTELGMSPFRAVDKVNIISGFNGAFKKAVAENKSFGDAITVADKLVRNTQFNYLNIDTPLAWHGAIGSLASQYQSWWTRFLEEVWSWGGTMPYGDGTSRTIKVAKHAINVAKSKEMARYLRFNLILLAAMKGMGLGYGLFESKIPVPGISSGPLPTSIPPALNGLFGTGEALYGTLIGNEYVAKDGWQRMKREYPHLLVPGMSAMKKIYKVKTRERPLKSLIVPITKEEIESFREGF